MQMMDIDAILEQMRPRLDTHGLDSRIIRSHLGDCPWRVYLFSEVDSTNTRLKEMAKVGSPAGGEEGPSQTAWAYTCPP